jgi:hypothetical protein
MEIMGSMGSGGTGRVSAERTTKDKEEKVNQSRGRRIRETRKKFGKIEGGVGFCQSESEMKLNQLE